MSPAATLILEMQIYPIIRNTIPRKAKPVGSEDYQELRTQQLWRGDD